MFRKYTVGYESVQGHRKTIEKRIRYFVSTKSIGEGLMCNIVGGTSAVPPRIVMVQKVVGDTMYYLEANKPNTFDHVYSKDFRCFGY